jgi:hypothetical protein
MRIRSPQDLGAAVILAVIGLGGLWFGDDLDVGSFAQMGPGYLPMVLSYGMLVFAGIVLLRAVTDEGPPVETMVPRAVLLVLAGILLFALLIETAGLVVTVLAVTIVAGFGSREMRWRDATLLGAGLAVFAVVVFVYGLRQPLPIFWGGG